MQILGFAIQQFHPVGLFGPCQMLVGLQRDLGVPSHKLSAQLFRCGGLQFIGVLFDRFQKMKAGLAMGRLGGGHQTFIHQNLHQIDDLVCRQSLIRANFFHRFK